MMGHIVCKRLGTPGLEDARQRGGLLGSDFPSPTAAFFYFFRFAVQGRVGLRVSVLAISLVLSSHK